jgi:hypothetical protein
MSESPQSFFKHVDRVAISLFFGPRLKKAHLNFISEFFSNRANGRAIRPVSSKQFC